MPEFVFFPAPVKDQPVKAQSENSGNNGKSDHAEGDVLVAPVDLVTDHEQCPDAVQYIGKAVYEYDDLQQIKQHSDDPLAALEKRENEEILRVAGDGQFKGFL